jgi:hypothetical protein
MILLLTAQLFQKKPNARRKLDLYVANQGDSSEKMTFFVEKKVFK